MENSLIWSVALLNSCFTQASGNLVPAGFLLRDEKRRDLRTRLNDWVKTNNPWLILTLTSSQRTPYCEGVIKKSHITRVRQLGTNYRNRSHECNIHVLTSSDSPSPFSPDVAAALSKSVPSSLMINLNSFTGTGIIVHCSGAETQQKQMNR